MAAIDFGTGPNTATGDTVAQAFAKLQARLDALPSVPAAPTGFYGNGSTNPALRAAFGRVKAGTGRGRWVMKGDSTTIGQWATNGNPNGMGNSRPSRPAALIAQAYTSAGILMLDNSVFGDAGLQASYGSGGGNIDVYDTRVGTGAGISANGGSQEFAGGAIISASTNNVGSLWSFTASDVDTFEITGYVSTTGDAGLQIDGAAPASGTSTVSFQSPDGTLRTAIIKAASAGTHTGSLRNLYTFNARSIVAYNSAKPAWDILCHAALGASSAQQAKGDGKYRNLDSLKFDAPDFTTINLGLNDFGQSVPVATYVANLSAIIDAARLTGDVLLIFPHPATNSASIPQADYHAAAKQLAASKGVAFLSLYEHYGSGSDTTFTARTKDGVHPLGPLYADIATTMKQAIDFMRGG